MPSETPDKFSTFQIRVYYEDTDAGGVVFYANYLKFLERARTEWLRELGVGQHELAQRERRGFVVKGLEIQYRRPARLDDLLIIRSRVVRLGPASITFEQFIDRERELLCASTIQVCCLDLDTFRPVALPIELRTLLEKVQE